MQFSLMINLSLLSLSAILYVVIHQYHPQLAGYPSTDCNQQLRLAFRERGETQSGRAGPEADEAPARWVQSRVRQHLGHRAK